MNWIRWSCNHISKSLLRRGGPSKATSFPTWIWLSWSLMTTTMIWLCSQAASMRLWGCSLQFGSRQQWECQIRSSVVHSTFERVIWSALVCMGCATILMSGLSLTSLSQRDSTRTAITSWPQMDTKGTLTALLLSLVAAESALERPSLRLWASYPFQRFWPNSNLS